jgi:hypothetical protein
MNLEELNKKHKVKILRFSYGNYFIYSSDGMKYLSRPHITKNRVKKALLRLRNES